MTNKNSSEKPLPESTTLDELILYTGKTSRFNYNGENPTLNLIDPANGKTIKIQTSQKEHLWVEPIHKAVPFGNNFLYAKGQKMMLLNPFNMEQEMLTDERSNIHSFSVSGSKIYYDGGCWAQANAAFPNSFDPWDSLNTHSLIVLDTENGKKQFRLLTKRFQDYNNLLLIGQKIYFSSEFFCNSYSSHLDHLDLDSGLISSVSKEEGIISSVMPFREGLLYACNVNGDVVMKHYVPGSETPEKVWEEKNHRVTSIAPYGSQILYVRDDTESVYNIKYGVYILDLQTSISELICTENAFICTAVPASRETFGRLLEGA